MSLGAEIFRFIFDLMKIISMIIAVIVILFVVTAVITGIYGELVFACPDRRLRFTDEEAISFTKKYIEKDSFYRNATISKNYNSRRETRRVDQFGWFVSRNFPTKTFHAERIDVYFWGGKDDEYVECTMLACGVMLGCDNQ